MDLQLQDATVVVTGAGKGIGLAVCEALAAEGARVIANVRTPSTALSALADRASVTLVAGDITATDTRARLVEAAGGAPHALVNNAGIAPARPEGFLAVPPDDWAHTFALDLFAGIEMIRAVLPGMLARGSGCVVNVGSLNARLPDPLVIDYSAAKAAFGNVAKSLSKAYGPQGIRFTSVDPGPVATDLWNGAGGVAATVSAAAGIDPAEVRTGAAGQMPTGRFSTPAEVAVLVTLLCSPRVSNVTGSSFVIDGGMAPML
ncbi:SDR family NAD(P)-dependent oxidoreductase [Demequina soli]|uniref:SDR family NAD(P)-dependent oxidoreductase n=1 Tax=Demequina soli TaxID=1638987 RepID=UPI000784C34E|nr:SDR family oxidoreductase [Demequina soli]